MEGKKRKKWSVDETERTGRIWKVSLIPSYTDELRVTDRRGAVTQKPVKLRSKPV